MSEDFHGRPALVTGGTRGIGRAIAERLRDLGAAVIVTGTRPDGEAPEGCAYVPVDFTDTTQVEDFCGKVTTDIRPLIVVNNAGINKIGPFAELDPADFDRIQAVNVRAPFMVTRAALPAMIEARWGRVVTLSSIWGKISKEFRAPYSTSKFAVDGMMAALSAEVAQHGILANCVAPGFIDTELTRAVLGEAGMAELSTRVPCRRLGTAEEVARFVCWLAGPENTYITGQNLAIDGGFTRV